MKRDYSLDVIKLIAMYGVIALHTTLCYIGSDTVIANVLFYSFVISVPLFFMTSGYLLLGRSDANYKYSIRKIVNILKIISFFVLCWWILYNLKTNEWNLKSLVGNIAMSLFQKGVFWQFWYFGSMIGLYLLYPVINRLFTKKFRSFVYLTICLMLVQWIVFNFNIINYQKLDLIIDKQQFREIIEIYDGGGGITCVSNI